MASDTPAPEFLTTREVAALLRVRERKVYDLAAAGEIPCRRVTGKLLFPRAELERWLAGSGEPDASPTPGEAAERPNVIVGSHDPLLEWALRESGSGLATFFDGSLDGLERLAAGEAIACGTHVLEPEGREWNLAHVAAAVGSGSFGVLEWAKRQQGLIVAADAQAELCGIADLPGRRVALRQPKAGARILFEHLLDEAGLAVDRLDVVEPPARTEIDAAAAVASGDADVALGLEAMARQYRLGFRPLIDERYDVVVHRRAFFEPPLQGLFAFCRQPAFAAKAAALGGYDLADHGRVHWNGA